MSKDDKILVGREAAPDFDEITVPMCGNCDSLKFVRILDRWHMHCTRYDFIVSDYEATHCGCKDFRPEGERHEHCPLCLEEGCFENF